jgi:hypothetical protein
MTDDQKYAFDLRKQANEGAEFRGHSLQWSVRHSESRTIHIGVCTRCEMQVTVNTRPQPNDIDIGGEAVALTCLPHPLHDARAVRDRYIREGYIEVSNGQGGWTWQKRSPQ